PPLDLLPGLKRRLLLALGVLEAPAREIALELAPVDAPVPAGPEGAHLLPKGHGAERPSPVALPGSRVHVPLQVLEGEGLDVVALAERAGEVAKVHPDGGERVLLDRPVHVRLQIAIR